MRKSGLYLIAVCILLAGCLPPNPVPLDSHKEQTSLITQSAKEDTTDRNGNMTAEAPLPTGTEEGTEENLSFEECLQGIPDYVGDFIIEIPPYGFDKSITTAYEKYSELDSLGRCGTAEALIGKELMPTEPRGEIGMVKPTGWHTVRYDDLIEDKYLYNRCHVLGFQLTGENDNVRNLITGTRYFNVEGMLPYENMVANYIRLTGNHVYYRVTPVFEEDNLLCKGVWMEAEVAKHEVGMHEEGGILFSVFVYNIQPGVWINYETGDSCRESVLGLVQNFILNTKTMKFHEADCEKVADIGGKNKKEYSGTREALTKDGYEPCGWCNP